MISTMPEIGASVIFTEGQRKPREWNGKVIEHVPADEEWSEGVTVFWPKMKWRRKTGVRTFHSIPNQWLKLDS